MKMAVNVGEVKTFPNVAPSKAQALKVLEESAEVFSAFETWLKTPSDDYEEPFYLEDMFNECADVITATCNLIAAFGRYDFTPYMQACEQRNRQRGRYDVL